MIELSVSLPMYKAKHIGWLAIESLARQQEIDFEWELVIAEEMLHSMGEDEVLKYKDRLENVGCVRLEYMKLPKWIPLTTKLLLIMDNCSDSSIVWAGQAADTYSAPLRLRKQYDSFKSEKYDWFLPTKAIYYHIVTGQTILHDTSLVKRKDDCIGKAISFDLLRGFDASNQDYGSDGWFWNASKSIKENFNIFFDDSDNWKYGVSTFGLNNYMNRDRSFINPMPPWRVNPIDIKNAVPGDVLERLKGCKKYAIATREIFNERRY